MLCIRWFKKQTWVFNPLLTELRLYNVGLISDLFWGSLYIPELQNKHIISVTLMDNFWRQGQKISFKKKIPLAIYIFFLKLIVEKLIFCPCRQKLSIRETDIIWIFSNLGHIAIQKNEWKIKKINWEVGACNKGLKLFKPNVSKWFY